MSVSVRLRPEAESALVRAVAASGRPRNALINEAILGWLAARETANQDWAALIRAHREKFAQVPVFDEREITAEGRKW